MSLANGDIISVQTHLMGSYRVLREVAGTFLPQPSVFGHLPED